MCNAFYVLFFFKFVIGRVCHIIIAFTIPYKVLCGISMLC